MWKIYKYDGHYIRGEFISQHSTESAALKKAKKIIDFTKSTKEKGKQEIVIWLDSDNGMPMGMIVKNIRKKGDEMVSTG
jgi:hypothetical protein